MTVERLRITSQETKALRGLAKKQKAGNARGPFAKTFPTLEGRGVQAMHPRIINVSFDVTQEVAAALRALRDTGLFGNGVDCASVAEELLRRALRDPEVAAYWQAPQVGRLGRLRFDPPTPALRDLLRRSAAKLHRKKTSP
jgi:hypothetical protein